MHVWSVGMCVHASLHVCVCLSLRVCACVCVSGAWGAVVRPRQGQPGVLSRDRACPVCWKVEGGAEGVWRPAVGRPSACCPIPGAPGQGLSPEFP